MNATHFAAAIRRRNRPDVEVHGPICDRLLLPLASAGSAASGWDGGHRKDSLSSRLRRITWDLLAGNVAAGDGYTAEPLTEAEHDARYPVEPETELVGGYPAAMFAPRPAGAST